MKTLWLAGAAVLTSTVAGWAAPPAPAGLWASGDGALYAGLYNLTTPHHSPDDNTNGGLAGGLARANLWLKPTMSAQFDLSGESLSETNFNDSYALWDLAGHLSYRNAPGHLIGAFASVGYNTYWSDGIASAGLEGQMYIGSVQLYAQAGYTTSTSGSPVNAAYVHAEARYFVHPNLMLAANLGYARSNEVSEDEPHDFIRWGADLEWRQDNSPFGLFLSYQGSLDVEPEDTVDNTTVHSILGGIKVYFGGDTLKSQADSGATLRDFNPYNGTNHVRFSDWE